MSPDGATEEPGRRHSWAVRVPATSANLGPGFDTLGLALARHLVVGAREADDGPRVTMTGEGAEELPTDDENLVWRSFVAGCEAFGADVPDLVLDVANDIPLERGLGSSSAAIVGGLALARAVLGAAVGDRDLVGIACGLEGHPDNVAPAVLGGFVVAARHDDGSLVVRRAQPPAGARVLLHVPVDRQLTTAARGGLPERLEAPDVVTQIGRTAVVTGGMTGAWRLDPGLFGDRMHEAARRRVQPRADAQLTALRDRGQASWLSGSGPTVATLVDDRTDVGEWADAGDDVVVSVVDLDLGGVIACPRTGCAWAATGDCGACPHRRL